MESNGEFLYLLLLIVLGYKKVSQKFKVER